MVAMNSYAVIDPTINSWAKRHGLVITTEFKDSQVRSASLVNPKGDTFQIWVDPPRQDTVGVHVWDYEDLRQDWEIDISQLDSQLEHALHVVRSWMSSNIH
jgi:hypothetical protein